MDVEELPFQSEYNDYKKYLHLSYHLRYLISIHLYYIFTFNYLQFVSFHITKETRDWNWKWKRLAF